MPATQPAVERSRGVDLKTAVSVAERRLVIAGGSGFLGRALAAWFAGRGWEVAVLSRGMPFIHGASVVTWDAKSAGTWAQSLEGADALINLAGRSVNCRYNARNRREIMQSRLDSTRALGRAMQSCARPPDVWLQSSTATIYKHTFGAPHTEEGEIGAAPIAKDAFSVEVATAWERAFHEAAAPLGSVRGALLRTAIVFGAQRGSAYALLHKLASICLGGAMAGGRQYVSWIHENDFCRALEWLIDQPAARGIYNIAAPETLTNAELMRELRARRRMPIGLPAARWMLEVGMFMMRSEAELVVKSRRVAPARLLREGFRFEFPSPKAAMRDLERRFTEKRPH